MQTEALIFSAKQAISLEEIKACLEKVYEKEEEGIDETLLKSLIEQIQLKYSETVFPFELVPISQGYMFMTKQEYHRTISVYLNQKSKKRLSRAALETLAIIAYKQPVTKAEIEQIRGVNCDYSVQKLLEKDLVQMEGRSDAAGRPMLYGTGQFFMDYFGIESIEDLPQLKDIKSQNTNEIGEGEQDIIIEEEELDEEMEADMLKSLAGDTVAFAINEKGGQKIIVKAIVDMEEESELEEE